MSGTRRHQLGYGMCRDKLGLVALVRKLELAQQRGVDSHDRPEAILRLVEDERLV
jgi:hypothetical protein